MIRLDSLRKVYPGDPDVVALDGISLNIAAGEIHGIVGQSGAGKSTLIRCLTALERPTSGSVTVDGMNLSAISPSQLRQARRKIGMVFQGGNLLDQRTAAQNVSYPLQISGVAKKTCIDRAHELLDVVGLAGRGRNYPSELSGGQRQRVAIARALAAEPKVLLCDEPTSALDSETTDQILDLIAEVRDRTGVTVVIITHEMDVVRKVCSNVTLLENGSIVQSGSVSDVLADTQSRLGRALVPVPVAEAAKGGFTLLDVAFSAHPGEPAGSRVLNLAAAMGADVSAGTFESAGANQVARLVLSVPTERVDDVERALRSEGVNVEVRP